MQKSEPSLKKRPKKKPSQPPSQEFSMSWKGWVCLSALLLAMLGGLVVILLTPSGQQPEEWAVQSWVRLWDVFDR